MKMLIKNRTACFEAFFFFALIPGFLFFSLFHGDSSSVYFFAGGQRLPISATADDFLTQFPHGDISYQLKFAVDYLREGLVSDWVLNLWPPGLPVLYLVMLKLSGFDYFPLKVVAVSAIFYSAASFLVYRSIFQGRFSSIGIVLCVAPLLFVSFQKSIFFDLNLFSTDFYCFSLLAILLSLVFRARGGFVRLLLISVVLAGLAYFRSFYFILIKLTTVAGFGVFVVWATSEIVSKGWRVAIKKIATNKTFESFGLIIVLVWLFLLPWKAYLVVNAKPFDWTSTDQAWAAQWRNDLPNFLVGLNTPCVIEKDLCAQLMPFQLADTWATPKLGTDFYKRLSLATFLATPAAWYAEKKRFFHVFWFDGNRPKKRMTAASVFEYLQSLTLLAMCLGLVLFSAFRSLRALVNLLRDGELKEGDGLYLLFLCFFACNFIVYTFVHFESRYSAPLKLVSYLFCLYLFRGNLSKIDFQVFFKNQKRSV